MPRYALLLLTAAAAPITAWPQIFDKPSTATTTVTTTFPILNSTTSSSNSSNSTVSSRSVGSHQLPYQVIKVRTSSPDPEPRQLVASAKFRDRSLPVVDGSLFNYTLPVTKGATKNSRSARGLPVIGSDLFNITLPVASIEGLSEHINARGLPVIGDDPAALYKIAIPASIPRGLPVVDSDPLALYKITLPVSQNSKRDGEADAEITLPVEFRPVDSRGLPVLADDEVSLSVTLPVSLDARGLPVITNDPDSIFKITLPIVKTSSSGSSTVKRAIELSSVPPLHLSVPLVFKRDPKAALPTDTVAGDDAFTLTLPVSIHQDATKNNKRQHVADGSHAVTIRPPTDAENVPMKHYARGVTLRPPTAKENVPMHHYRMEHKRSEYGKTGKRAPHGILKMPVVKQKKRGLTSTSGQEIEKALDKLAKRDGEVIEMSVANRSDVSYYAQLDFGTPAQSIYVQIDTGSFELWINPSCDNLSSGDQIFCQAVGLYNYTGSSTSAGPLGTKSLRYGIGAANVSYYTDTIAVGPNSTLASVQFGVADSTEDQFAGIMGLGYGSGDTISYKNFVDELASQNITSTKAFSLGLGAKDHTDGVLIFGGVDTRKFTGPLTKLPIIPAADSPDGVPRYWVQMENITITPPSGQESSAYNGSNIPAFLDSGATLTLLPPNVANAIAADFGATNGVSENGFYSIDCSVAKANGSINFAFNGLQVQVPYAEMVRTLATSPPTCWLGLIPSTDFTLLGDTFLRSVYAVFDVEHDAAYLAHYENCGEELLSISNGTNLAYVTGKCERTVATATPPSSEELATMTATSKSDIPAIETTSTPTDSATSAVETTPAATTAVLNPAYTTATAAATTATITTVPAAVTSSVAPQASVVAETTGRNLSIKTAGAAGVGSGLSGMLSTAGFLLAIVTML